MQREIKHYYAEIIQGFSTAIFNKKTIYFKHLTNLELANIESRNKQYYEEAISQGILTEEELLQQYINDEIWSLEKEDRIKQIKIQVDLKEKSKKKQSLPSIITKIDQEIKKLQNELKNILVEKQSIILGTAEFFCSKRTNEDTIVAATFLDSHFQSPYFDDDSSGEDIDDMSLLYLDCINKINMDILYHIAINDTFLNNFCICKDNPYNFYGKPVIHLSHFQSELFACGLYFKNILSHHQDIPDNIKKDPYKLIDWHHIKENTPNYQKQDSKRQDREFEAVGIVGATKEDLNQMGIDNQQKGVSLSKLAKEKGGRLTMKDMMEAHGIKTVERVKIK